MPMQMPTGAKTGIVEGLTAVLDKLAALASLVGEAETNDEAAVPPEVSEALRQVSAMLQGVCEQYCLPPAEDTETPPESTSEPAPEGAPSEPAPEEKSEVQKAGKKIASARFQKLAELHDALGKLLKELAGEAPAAPAVEPTAKAVALTEASIAKLFDDRLAAMAKSMAPDGRHEADASRGIVPEPEPVAKKNVSWPLDLSADLAKRRQR